MSFNKIVQKAYFALTLRRYRAARRLFAGENADGDVILDALKDFCYVENTFHKDPNENARRQGRREVFDFLVQLTNLSREQVANIKEKSR